MELRHLQRRIVSLTIFATLCLCTSCSRDSRKAPSAPEHQAPAAGSSSEKLSGGEAESEQKSPATIPSPQNGSLQGESPQPHDSSNAVTNEPFTQPSGSETPSRPISFRASDTRPRHDPRQLEQLGIRTFESQRLRLHTDLDPQVAADLPKIIDALYDALVDFFGPLPPNREGSEYQITGYLMKDRELFRRTGLLPEELPQVFHGRHRGAEFWMNDQEFDYYRRHLLIHEATHCFMTAIEDVQAPAWYMEGMAELFGTHRIEPNGEIRFRIMPDSEENFVGFGRIRMVRTDVASGRILSLSAIDRLRPGDFLENSNYGWAWALCEFLDSHPRYRDRFRELGKYTTGTQFSAKLVEFFQPDLAELGTEWILFAANLQFSFDFERAAITFREGMPLAEAGTSARAEIAADRGWQASGVVVEKGVLYDIAATGEFTLADDPVPWVSGPRGVSIFYSEGRPIGHFLAAIRTPASPTVSLGQVAEQQTESMLEVIPVGEHARFAAPVTGTLYFRVNDFWRSLADNKGSVAVEVRREAKPHE